MGLASVRCREAVDYSCSSSANAYSTARSTFIAWAAVGLVLFQGEPPASAVLAVEWLEDSEAKHGYGPHGKRGVIP